MSEHFRAHLKVVCLVLLVICATLFVSWHWHGQQASTRSAVFVFAQITDSHCGASGYTEKTNQSIQWIRNQEPIDFVVHTGDLVQRCNNHSHWSDVYQIMHQLDGVQNWTVLAGNHDVDFGNNLTYFTSTFGHIINHTEVFGDFVFITMSWTTRDGTISSAQFDWLDTQLELYRNYKVIVAHHWLHSNPEEGHNYTPSPSVKTLCNHLSDYSNVLLALSGHNHENDDWRHYGENPHFVVSKSVGRGYVRLFYCYSNGSIHVRTRDVPNSTYLAGADNDFWISHVARGNIASAAYVVWKDGNTYYAESTLLGGTDHNGTVAAKVIQSALDALTNGGLVFLKRGTYNLGTTELSVVHNGTTIMGEGFGTIIQFSGAPEDRTDAYAITAQEKNNIRISNLTIEGTLADGNHAIFIYGTTEFMLDHMWIRGVGEESIFVYKYGSTVCIDGIIKDNLIEGGGGHAIELNYGTKYVTIANNVIRNCHAKSGLPGGAGIQLCGDSAGTYTTDYNTVVGNVIESCQPNIRLVGHNNHNVVTNNICSASASDGIQIDQYSKNNDVTGNIFDNNSANGIYIRNNSSNNNIENNVCRGNGAHGIIILHSTCNANIVKMNDLRGNTSGGLLDAGTETVAHFNIG
jgi:parallel beta-helix repeat protein